MAPPVLDVSPDDPALASWCDSNAIPYKVVKPTGKSVNPHSVCAALRNLSHHEAAGILAGRIGKGAFVVMYRGTLRNENDLKAAGLNCWSFNPEGIEPGSASQNRPINSCECTLTDFIQSRCTHVAAVQGMSTVGALFLPDSDYLLDPANDADLANLVQALANTGAPIISTGLIPAFDPKSSEPFAEYLPGADCPKVEGWQGLVERNGEWLWLASVKGNSFGYDQMAPRWWFEPVPGFTLVNAGTPAFLARVELKRWACQGVFTWNLVTDAKRKPNNPIGSHVLVPVAKTRSNMVDAFDFVPVFFTRQAWQQTVTAIRGVPPGRVRDSVARCLPDANRDLPKEQTYAFDPELAVDAIIQAASPRLNTSTVMDKFVTMAHEARRQVAHATAADWGMYALLTFLHFVACMMAGTFIGFVSLLASTVASDLLDWTRVMHVDVARHSLRVGTLFLGTIFFFLPGIGRLGGGVDRFVVAVVSILVDVYATKTRRATGPTLGPRRLLAGFLFALLFTAYWAHQPSTGSDTLTAGFWQSAPEPDDAIGNLLSSARSKAERVVEAATPLAQQAVQAGQFVARGVQQAAVAGFGMVGNAASSAVLRVESDLIHYQPIDTPAGPLCFSSICRTVTGYPYIEADPVVVLRDPLPRCLTALCEYRNQIPIRLHGPYNFGSSWWCAPGDFICALDPNNQIVDSRFLEPQPIRINGKYMMGCANPLCEKFTMHPRQGMVGSVIVHSSWAEIGVAVSGWVMCLALIFGMTLYDAGILLWEATDEHRPPRADGLSLGRVVIAPFQLWFRLARQSAVLNVGTGPFNTSQLRNVLIGNAFQLVGYYMLWYCMWGFTTVLPLSDYLRYLMLVLAAPLFEERLGIAGRLMVCVLELCQCGTVHVLAFRLMVTVPFQLCSCVAQIIGTWGIKNFWMRVLAHAIFNSMMLASGMTKVTASPVSLNLIGTILVLLGVIVVLATNYSLSVTTGQIREACQRDLHAPLTCGSVGVVQSNYAFWRTNEDQRATEQLHAEARKALYGWLLIGVGIVCWCKSVFFALLRAFAASFVDPTDAYDGATYRELLDSLREHRFFQDGVMLGSLSGLVWNPTDFKAPPPPRKANASIIRCLQPSVMNQQAEETEGLADNQQAITFWTTQGVPQQIFAPNIANCQGALVTRFIKPARKFDPLFNAYMGIGAITLLWSAKQKSANGKLVRYTDNMNLKRIRDRPDWETELYTADCVTLEAWIPGRTDDLFETNALRFIDHLPSCKKDKWRKAAYYRRTEDHVDEDGNEIVIDSKKDDHIWPTWPLNVDYSLSTRTGAFQQMLIDTDNVLCVSAFVKDEILSAKVEDGPVGEKAKIKNKPRQIIFPSEYNTVVEQVAIWDFATCIGTLSRATKWCMTMGLTALNLGNAYNSRCKVCILSSDVEVCPMAAGDDSVVPVNDPGLTFDINKCIQWYKNIGRDPTPRVVSNMWDATFCSGHFLPVQVDGERHVVWYNLPGKLLAKLLAIMVDAAGNPGNMTKTALTMLADKIKVMKVNHSGNPILAGFFDNLLPLVVDIAARCPGVAQKQRLPSNFGDEFQFGFTEAMTSDVQETPESATEADRFCVYRYGFTLNDVHRSLTKLVNEFRQHDFWTAAARPNALVYEDEVILKLLRVDAAGTEAPVGDAYMQLLLKEKISVVKGLGDPTASVTSDNIKEQVQKSHCPEWLFLSAPALDVYQQLIFFWLIRAIEAHCLLMVAVDVEVNHPLVAWLTDLVTVWLNVGKTLVVVLAPRMIDRWVSDNLVFIGANRPDLDSNMPTAAVADARAVACYLKRKASSRWAVLDLFHGDGLRNHRRELLEGVFSNELVTKAYSNGSAYTDTIHRKSKAAITPDSPLVDSGVIYYASIPNTGGTHEQVMPFAPDREKFSPITTLAGVSMTAPETVVAIHSPEGDRMSNIMVVSYFAPITDGNVTSTTYGMDGDKVACGARVATWIRTVALLLFFSTGAMTSKVLGHAEHFLSWAWTIVKRNAKTVLEFRKLQGPQYSWAKIDNIQWLHPIQYVKERVDMDCVMRFLLKACPVLCRFFVMENDMASYDSSHTEDGFSAIINAIFHQSGLEVDGAKPWKLHAMQDVKASGIVKLTDEQKRQNIKARLKWQLGSGHAFTTILNCFTNIIEAIGSTAAGLGLTMTQALELLLEKNTEYKLPRDFVRPDWWLIAITDRTPTEQWLSHALDLEASLQLCFVFELCSGRVMMMEDHGLAPVA